jgi:DNA repair protein RecO (recombination protein O)
MTEADYFDLKNGVFSQYKPDSVLYLSPPHTRNFMQLLYVSFEHLYIMKFSNDERRYLLAKLLEYYALHVEGFGHVHAHEILEEVLG